MPLGALTALSARPEADVLTRYVAADRMMVAGQGPEAWQAANLALSSIDAGNKGALAMRVRILAARLCAEYGDPAQARQLIESTGKLLPNDPNTIIAEGVLASQSGGEFAAYKDLVRAASMLPADGDAWYRAGRALLAAKLYPDAISALKRAASIAPNDASVHAQLSDALTKNSQFDEGIAELKIAGKLAGDDPATIAMLSFSRAYAARTDADYHESEKLFREELAANPTNSRVRAMLAGLQIRFGRASDARNTLKDYLLRVPNDSDEWLVLETVCRRIRDDKGAEQAHAQFRHLVDTQAAATELTKQVQIHPNDAMVFFRLCLALHNAGRNRDAYAALQKAARLDPVNRQIAQMLVRVSQAMRSAQSNGNVTGKEGK